MARADRRRAQRTRPAAAARRSDVVIEDTMFFPRLRRHAKWMFLFLALVFGLGFVGFGVGAGGIGFGDVIRDAAGGGGQPSVSDAEKRVLDNPKDAQGVPDLSTAQQAAGNTDGAIEALQSYIAAPPEEHRRAARARRPLPAEGVGGAGARADLPGTLRLLRPRRHPRHDLPARRQPARARPDHERGEHQLRAADLGGRVGDPDSVGAGGRPVPQDRRLRSRRIRASSSSWRRPRSRPTTSGRRSPRTRPS